MPLDIPVERESSYLLVITYINFCMSYTNWKRDIPLSCLSLIPFYAIKLYDGSDSTGKLTAIMIVNLIWLSLTLFATHLAIEKIGMYVTDNSVLLDGNKQFIQNLSKRVLILEPTSKEIIYSNINKSKPIAALIENRMAKDLVKIDKGVFSPLIADCGNVIREINKSRDLISIEEIT